jgi:hypothetical protein
MWSDSTIGGGDDDRDDLLMPLAIMAIEDDTYTGRSMIINMVIFVNFETRSLLRMVSGLSRVFTINYVMAAEVSLDSYLLLD